MSKFIRSHNGVLYIEEVSAVELAETYDTPLYVMSENTIRDKYRVLSETLSRNFDSHRILYSAKANTNISILKLMNKLGAYLDTVSPGEIYLAMEAGFQPDRILFTGTMVRDDELKFVLDSGVPVNVDSLSELRRLLRIQTPEFLSVRINPEFGAGHHEHVITAGRESKFGVWEREAIKAYAKAKEAGVKRFGIQMHIGSGILEVEPYILALQKLLEIARKIHVELDVTFELIDIGGGLGVPYRPGEKALNLDVLFDELSELFKLKVEEYKLGEPVFAVEPGRFLVCEAGVLLTRVNTVAVKPYKKFVGVDAGFNTLIRPAMYGSYHPIVVANKMDKPPTETYTVAGPICESGDLLAKDRRLPEVEEGDLLAILNAGAYGFSMSSQYNSRPRAAEVLVKGEKHELIRSRETFEVLKQGQRVASWLR
ncbi:diaminopimelate decarboxylase [Candidatus Bathyarchaeota archaeon]|nr:MAG: diaminopimelate decarboxylase [Candidatus Bathyarchaeota archaeon]